MDGERVCLRLRYMVSKPSGCCFFSTSVGTECHMSNVAPRAGAVLFFLSALLGQDANFTTGLRLFSAPTFLLIHSDNALTAQPPVVMKKLCPARMGN